MAPRQQKSKVADMDKTELESLIANAVKDAVQNVCTAIEDLKQEVANLKSALSDRDEEINMLKEKLESRLDEQEQYGRRNNIRIFGIPEQENENTDQIVLDVAKRIQAKVDISLIDRSHRVGRRGEKPRPVIVKFTSYAARRAVFSVKKNLKGSGITIREDLTVSRLSLLKRSMEEYGNRNVWSIDGVIMIKIGNKKPLRVRSDQELDSLLARHPPE